MLDQHGRQGYNADKEQRVRMKAMLTDAELVVLMADIESDRVERKAAMERDGKVSARVYEAICAFANDMPDHKKPGVVFVGANDDGSCANLPITDQMLQNLGDTRSNGNIVPFPTLNVQKRTINGCELAVVEVQPSYTPPVRYNGRVWIRVGPRRATATGEEERRLAEKRRAGDLPFDYQPVFGASMDDLDMTLFIRVYVTSAVAADVLEENDRSPEQQLASLHFLTKDGLPNNGAILVLGKDPREWLPGAYIQFLKIAGTELADPVTNQKEISGPLPDMLRQLVEVLEANISVASDTSGITEQQTADYPIVALRELAFNAVLHRSYETASAPIRIYWYSDRVEIHSPGGPYDRVTVENFGQPGPTAYRNQLLAQAMKDLRFVQRFGRGIALARRYLQLNGNPELEFKVNENWVVAIVKRLPLSKHPKGGLVCVASPALTGRVSTTPLLLEVEAGEGKRATMP